MSGGRILYLPDLCSEYYGQQTLRGLARQHFRYGYSKPRTIHKHPASLHTRHLAAPALIAFIFIFGVLAPLIREAAFLWGVGNALYLLTAIFFAFRSAHEHGYHILLRLPSVFITIHMAWGCGFWCGVSHLLKGQFTKPGVSLP